jgi:CheY-like chemotaxis protein
MLSAQSFEEIRVYDGFAERTGARFEKNDVRRRDGYCGSMTQLLQKARSAGEGTFYLPLGMWPAGAEQVPLKKQWVVMSSHQPARSPTPSPEETSIDQRCILIVDDDPSIRRLLLTYLRRSGFTLREAQNGREALETMRAGEADLVVMDLRMPEVSGWDVLGERAADAALRLIPVIVITANNVRDVAPGLADQNVAAVLAKPFDLAVLLDAVNGSLEHHPRSTPVAA